MFHPEDIHFRGNPIKTGNRKESRIGLRCSWCPGSAHRPFSPSAHWAAGDFDRARMIAKELVAQQPDVIIAISTNAATALQRETRTIPIVFLYVSDPVGAGIVADLP